MEKGKTECSLSRFTKFRLILMFIITVVPKKILFSLIRFA